MHYWDIRIGDKLRLKRDNRYGLGPIVVTVIEVRSHGHYKTPWIIGENLAAYRPSDFAGRA